MPKIPGCVPRLQTDLRFLSQKPLFKQTKKKASRKALPLASPKRVYMFAITNSNRISTKPSAKQTQLHC